MLEVKNLCKTYKTKKGVETHAIDGVSIRFPETGLVFLLGKSGSGKSTLLNLCGGLDRADSGEIIIMGKSSRDFKASDFDSYRNTFVGFVFQEYNILNEFTVEDNIALALELQNKKRDKQQIAEILKSVDLEEFADRKPNTLSGGQKQRVAIARALVKQPRIILADEPTGALDSETGRQVLETLKKLSEDKLVIVVSHDVEFAERYADRIIELKDGKIISDRTRENQSAPFAPTVENAQTRIYSEQESAMIRSRLPARHALRMGATSVMLKPVRLVFTVLLSIIAFVIFGLFSTVEFYNEQSVTRQSILNSDIQFLNYQKGYSATVSTYRTENGKTSLYSTQESVLQTDLTYEEYSRLNDIYNGSIAVINTSWGISNLTISDKRFYQSEYRGFAFTEDSNAVTMLAGRMPENSGEAAISDYTFACMQFGILTDGSEEDEQEIELDGYDDYTKIPVQDVCGTSITIVGVYKAENIPESYAELKQSSDGHLYTADDNSSDWYKEYSNGFYSYLLVDKSFTGVYLNYSDNSQSSSGSPYSYFKRTEINIGLNYVGGDDNIETFSYVNTYDVTNRLDLLDLYDLTGQQKVKSLENNQIAVPVSTYGLLLYDYLPKAVSDKKAELEEIEQQEAQEESGEEGNEPYKSQQLYSEFYSTDENGMNMLNRLYAVYHYGGYYTHDDKMDQETAAAILAEVDAFMVKWDITAPQVVLSNDLYYISQTAEIAAIFYSEPGNGCMYLGQNLYDIFYRYSGTTYTTYYETEYVSPSDACISGVFITRTQYEDALQNIVKASFNVNEDGSTVIIANSLAQEITGVNEIIYGLRYLSLGLWLGFTVFTILLMFNFISASITAKKKEIGILRAIGARSIDVFKIFLSESGIVTAVCLVLSVIICTVLCPVVSGAIISGTAISVSILVFTPVTFLFMLLVALFTAVISTIIPVAIYSKKPPVDSIRAL